MLLTKIPSKLANVTYLGAMSYDAKFLGHFPFGHSLKVWAPPSISPLFHKPIFAPIPQKSTRADFVWKLLSSGRRLINYGSTFKGRKSSYMTNTRSQIFTRSCIIIDGRKSEEMGVRDKARGQKFLILVSSSLGLGRGLFASSFWKVLARFKRSFP